MPSCQIRRPFGVSHSTVPMRSAEPSDSANSPRTVPVPNVVSPTILARPASCSAPDTISDELAVSLVDQRRRAAGPSRRRRARPDARCVVGRVALDVDDAAREELAGDADRLVDVAAGVAAQVEDDPIGAAARASLSAWTTSSAAPVRELLEADERRLRARHERPRDRLDRHVGADDGERPLGAVVAVLGSSASTWSPPRRGPSRRPRRSSDRRSSCRRRR